MAAKLWSENFPSGAGLGCMNERFFSALWICFMSFHFSFTYWVLGFPVIPSIHFEPPAFCYSTRNRTEMLKESSRFFVLPAACKDHRKALEVSQHSEEMGLILGVCAGGLVVLILLLGAVIIIIKKG